MVLITKNSVISFHIRTLFLVALFLTGSFTFTVSMLSKSTVLPQMSKDECHGVHQVDQVVLLLIDALRPDFALSALTHYYSAGEECGVIIETPNKSKNSNINIANTEDNQHDQSQVGGNGRRHENSTLRYVEESLQDITHPSHGFFLLADTPTITCQRLKAIATGTMPAFLEAGANLNTDAVVTDSLFRQLHGRSILLGDDTWLNLFPDDDKNTSLWKRTIAYPPYNVSDFDTNDLDVMKNLLPVLLTETIERAPADYAKLIVAHFLGVDHIGHRLHADHPAMGIKLEQLDEALRNISQFIRQKRNSSTRTLVLVFGDHGMTNSGDHGGDSYQETDTFMYAELFDGNANISSFPSSSLQRKTEMTRQRWNDNIDIDLTRLRPCRDAAGVHRDKLSAAHQVDMTSTIAVILGVPIPFSSFGRIIPEIVALVDPKANMESLEKCNWQQLISYFVESHLPINDAWKEGNLSWKMRIAQMSHFGRKTRTEMKRDGMFIGSTIFLIAALSFLWNDEVLQSLQGKNLITLWTLVLFIFRVCTVFANSFTIKESVELLSLFQILLLTGSFATPKRRVFFYILILLISIRVIVPLMCRDRSHITHVAEIISPMEEWINTNIPPNFRWETLGTLAGTIIFTAILPTTKYRLYTVAIFVLLASCYKRPVLHHVAPLMFLAVSLFVRNAGKMRYIVIVLWASSLCNENIVASTSIALYGAILPIIVKATDHLSPVYQGVLLHFFSWVGFFAQGHQCLFNTIDFNASFVGMPFNNIPISTVLVLTRTFNAFMLPPMSVMLIYSKRRTRGWRVCYVIMYLAVLQGSISCFNGYIQKSHLMLFPIFCPKLIFDLAACISTYVGYILTLVVM
ncbi:Type I phosphodiesterase/nucleotide pyrophosphatase/phosphate transferase [Trypanosoma melophagium]|uniref:Type I phosphodiesterase/nucleotide pyrophosphatase/phosphate transferase n=1 Tax=Trypanosoma melophagium TaxID=715481 RepID=UPI003519EDE0|nr:Type I phosphodiesterase/nucleotide pyrophosphatase/phosphate transferase [Trypanosoma melophagium]